ncbi:hypothetical protein S40288_00480 [Stachybotrys chartarum IBT 40288]|nr:hypothetical protein S40288_00480 [Stachybotrys chartarum IBT 40288]
MSRPDTVGTLLADIANLVSEGLRIFSFADKRQWGPDEHEQTRALQEVLEEAKKDFQELSPLLNGQFQYEHDRNHDSVEELRALRHQFHLHVQTLKDWARSGGPINPTWLRETRSLQRALHRAQCRAARRIHASEQESSARCLGAFLVHRVHRSWSHRGAVGEAEYQKMCVEELMACKRVGNFERFGDHDIAFVCDFCDGHMIWEDLAAVPTRRAGQNGFTLPVVAQPPPKNPTAEWQTIGITKTTREEREIVFAPVVIANHIPPMHRDWQARLLCPICEDIGGRPQEAGDDEDPWRPDGEFDDVAALQEHLEWEHAAETKTPSATTSKSSTNSCSVM